MALNSVKTKRVVHFRNQRKVHLKPSLSFQLLMKLNSLVYTLTTNNLLHHFKYLKTKCLQAMKIVLSYMLETARYSMNRSCKKIAQIDMV